MDKKKKEVAQKFIEQKERLSVFQISITRYILLSNIGHLIWDFRIFIFYIHVWQEPTTKIRHIPHLYQKP